MGSLRFLTSVLLIVFLLGTTSELHAGGAFNYLDDRASLSWADSVMRKMSLEEKIGQLFMIDVYSNKDSAHVNRVLDLIREYKVGGVIFFQGGPKRQEEINAQLQNASELPLLVSIDAEWGLSMRLDSTVRYPRQMTLGAAGDTTLIYEMGRQIGRECRAMGIHINFAPVADINNNPANPVINSRSFGEDKEKVALFSGYYMKGMQDEGVMACGKHFPGHGDTDTDSHHALPVINRTISQLDNMELYPFRKLARAGIGSMMVAHISLPQIIGTDSTPASLSPSIIDSLLVDELGFRGLVFTDALNMSGVTQGNDPGELEVKALQAGNDVLLFSTDIPLAIREIRKAVRKGRIKKRYLDQKVRKVLAAKYFLAVRSGVIANGDAVSEGPLFEQGELLSSTLYSRAVTLLSNRDMLPLSLDRSVRTASLVVNDTLKNPFQLMLDEYISVDHFRVDRDMSESMADLIVTALSGYDRVIISIHNTSTLASRGYGIPDALEGVISRLNSKTRLTVVLFGNPYGISRIPSASNAGAFVLGYEDTYWPQFHTAQKLFGVSPFTGRLPVSPAPGFKAGDGIGLDAVSGLIGFDHPLASGFLVSDFAGVDSIVQHALDERATPGCRVLMIKDGTVAYNRSFGYHTYDSIQVVRDHDIYDIASITKVMATTLAVMKLVEQGRIDIDKKIFKYVPDLRRTNKRNLVVSDILTHNAGLKAWLPLQMDLLSEGFPDTTLLKDFPEKGYSTTITQCLFLKDEYEDEIWQAIKDSPVDKKQDYVYSDLGMIIMQKAVEHITGKPLFDYVDEMFYRPMGLHRTFRSPVNEVPLNEVVPTEYDSVLRCELIHGFVHDPVASMMGGMAGHAGIFSDAIGVAVVMQMLMNGGSYAGTRYLEQAVVEKFTSKYFEGSFNRRGLGFDKPELIRTPDGPTAVSVSPATFGHSGFTGTCAWADPEAGIVYVFLSNRVYPSAGNKKLGIMNVRTEIMEEFYRVLKNK